MLLLITCCCSITHLYQLDLCPVKLTYATLPATLLTKLTLLSLPKTIFEILLANQSSSVLQYASGWVGDHSHHPFYIASPSSHHSAFSSSACYLDLLLNHYLSKSTKISTNTETAMLSTSSHHSALWSHFLDSLYSKSRLNHLSTLQ